MNNINFVAQKGKITTILGPNGSGKTTLFKCIIGIWNPIKGKIIVGSNNITNFSYIKRAKIFSVVPQSHELPFSYSVFEVVLMGRTPYIRLFSSPKKKDIEEAEKAISMLGIEHLRHKPYSKVSGGERQLALIARALCQNAPFMLLDEPVNHLDFKNQIKVLSKIRKLANKKGITVLITLHDPNLASLFSDNIVVINNGKVAAYGTPKILNKKLIKKVYDVEVNHISIDGHNILYPIIET